MVDENVYRRRIVYRSINAYLLKQQCDLRSASQSRVAKLVDRSQKILSHFPNRVRGLCDANGGRQMRCVVQDKNQTYHDIGRQTKQPSIGACSKVPGVTAGQVQRLVHIHGKSIVLPFRHLTR